jgi:nitrogen-specific signal transduction histidine kinase
LSRVREPADLLDALSIGVVVLDAQLCIIYANAAAQDALAFCVDQARGRSIGDFLGQSNNLVMTLRRALEPGEYIADREHSVRPFAPSCDAGVLDMTITPLASQVTGTHLLLEFADATERRSISHEKESIAPTASRLVIR